MGQHGWFWDSFATGGTSNRVGFCIVGFFCDAINSPRSNSSTRQLVHQMTTQSGMPGREVNPLRGFDSNWLAVTARRAAWFVWYRMRALAAIAFRENSHQQPNKGPRCRVVSDPFKLPKRYSGSPGLERDEGGANQLRSGQL